MSRNTNEQTYQKRNNIFPLIDIFFGLQFVETTTDYVAVGKHMDIAGQTRAT